MDCKVIKFIIIYEIITIINKQIKFIRKGYCRNPILVNISDDFNLEDLKVDTFESRGFQWKVVIPINNNYFYGIYQDANILFQANYGSCEKIIFSKQNITHLVNNPNLDPNINLNDPEILNNLEISPVIYKNNMAYNNMVSKVLYNEDLMNVTTKNIIMERVEGTIQYFITFLYLRVIRGDGMDVLEKFITQDGRWVKSKVSLTYSDNLALKHYAIYGTFDNIINNNNQNNNQDNIEDNDINLEEEDNG